MIDLAPFREVFLNARPRQDFFDAMDLNATWNQWQPHLRAIDELLPAADVIEHVKMLINSLTSRDPRLASKLLSTCQADAKMHRIGHLVAAILADRVQVVPADARAGVEESLLSWAVAQESETWDIDPEAGEILVYNLRWRIADLSLDVLPAVLGKVVGLLHDRLTKVNGDAGGLLRRFNWCMTAAKGLPSNHCKITPALWLIAEGKVPSSVAEAAQVLKNRVSDLSALDDAVLEQFGLPLWPCLVATRENGTVTLQNNGIGIARCVRATPSGTLFSDSEASNAVDLCPEKSIQLAVSGAPTTMEVQFMKYGAARCVQVPIAVVERPPSPASVAFDWARQAELLRATQRVLGIEESPDKGTISRAVRDGQLQYNGLSGRQCLVNVDSFKAWITKAKELANDEVLQIMDAVMNEIRSRKR